MGWLKINWENIQNKILLSLEFGICTNYNKIALWKNVPYIYYSGSLLE